MLSYSKKVITQKYIHYILLFLSFDCDNNILFHYYIQIDHPMCYDFLKIIFDIGRWV